MTQQYPAPLARRSPSPHRVARLSGLLLGALFLLAGLTACGGPVQSMVRGDNKIKAKPQRVALAPTQFYYDHYDVSPEGEEMFETNMSVGFVKHIGGYVVKQGEDDVGSYRRSREVKIKRHEKYRDEIADYVHRAFAKSIRDDGLAMVPLDEGTLPEKAFRPEKHKRYAAPSKKGTDNVNAPYFDVKPKMAVAEMPEVGADILLVPYVVYYYVHNRGWFIGQKWGAPAGARFRVMWGAYDTSNGQLLGWSDIDLKLVEEGKFFPNQSEIEIYRAQIHEAMFDKWIGKTLKL